MYPELYVPEALRSRNSMLPNLFGAEMMAEVNDDDVVSGEWELVQIERRRSLHPALRLPPPPSGHARDVRGRKPHRLEIHYL